jgi:hypothetical protein
VLNIKKSPPLYIQPDTAPILLAPSPGHTALLSNI